MDTKSKSNQQILSDFLNAIVPLFFTKIYNPKEYHLWKGDYIVWMWEKTKFKVSLVNDIVREITSYKNAIHCTEEQLNKALGVIYVFDQCKDMIRKEKYKL